MKKYDSYKDSGIEWIGQIPSHWKIMPLKYCFNIVSGATPKTERKEFWDGEIIWITPADYKTEDHYIENGNRNITLQGLNSCGTEIVPKGSLIFSKRAPIGTISIANTDLCTNQGCLSCVPKDENECNFFYYLLTQPIKELEILGSGATFLEISTTNFSNFDIPVPPLSEQKEIADYLDKKCGEIDTAVAKVDKEMELLDELKQSEISKAVTKGLNPNVSFKSSGIDWIREIPNHWKIMRFKHFADCRMGETILGEDLKDEGAIPVYSATLDDSVFGYVENAKLILKPNDFVIPARGNSIGNVSIIKNGIATCTQTTICARNIRDINIKYLFYCSRAYKENWFYYDATAIPQITVDQVNNNPVPVPSLSEQKEIADYLDKKCGEIDSLKEKLKRKKEKLQELRRSLISEVVTGKRKVI